MAKDKKTAKKVAKKVAKVLEDLKLAKESQTQKQDKPVWDTVKTNTANKIRPSKKRG
ncbi:MAG: hypothetical protein ACR2IA_12010 [Pyrinomonadaceae bacterium]